EFERLVSSQLPKGWKGSGDTGEKLASTEGLSELSQPGVFPSAIPSSDIRQWERQLSPNPLPESAALETSAIATDSETSTSSHSEAPIPAPLGLPDSDPLLLERSPLEAGESPNRSASASPSLNSGTKEMVTTGIPEAIASHSDDLLGDLWLDRPQPQPMPHSKSTFTDLKPSPESSGAIEEPQMEESPEALFNNSPIHQFTPQETSSDFYSKLKAVSQKQPQSPP
ncbi:MAG TPA: hypothetical protein V6D27_07830, partial [Vampirovibrionales bacterium]